MVINMNEMIILYGNRKLCRAFKRALSFISALYFLAPWVVSAEDSSRSESEAQAIACTAEILTETQEPLPARALTDQSRTTKMTLDAATKIAVKAEKEIDFLYIIWDKPVSSYTIEADGNKIGCGAYGFLHEYINPAEPFKNFVLTIPEGGGVLCDIYAFTAGEIPDWVQVWQPCQKYADILLLPTHGDDELLFFGGAIPYYAGELGLDVAVAFFTHHWGEPYRPHEQLNALWTAGLTLYPIFGNYEDIKHMGEQYARDNNLYENMLADQTALLRRLKPQVVVGHDLDGEYGHLTHSLSAKILCESLEISADPNSFPESYAQYGGWDVPKTYLHLYKENPVYIEWSDLVLTRFGDKTAFAAAQEAFSKYASQQSYKLTPSTPDSVYNCRKFGLYRSTVGSDSKGNDFMENIIPYAVQYAQTTAQTELETEITTTQISSSASDTQTDSTETSSAPADQNNPQDILRAAAVALLLAGSMAAVVIIRKKNRERQNKQ